MDKFYGLFSNPMVAMAAIGTILLVKDLALYPSYEYIQNTYATREEITEMKQDVRDIKTLIIEYMKQK